MKYHYAGDCTHFRPKMVDEDGGLWDMKAHAREITRKTFLKHVDPDEIREMAKDFGYSPNGAGGELTMASDWHIVYYRSFLYGRLVYFFVHSAYEHIFTEDGNLLP